MFPHLERIQTTLSTSDLSLMCQEPGWQPGLTNELWRQNTDVWSDGQPGGTGGGETDGESFLPRNKWTIVSIT